VKNLKNSNYILFSTNNFKKNMFEFYKQEFDYTNLNFFFSSNKEFIFLYFNLNSYTKNKDIFISFLNSNDIFFNILAIKYKNNFYDFKFFEEEFLINDDSLFFHDLLINFVCTLFINKLVQNKIIFFLFLKIFFDFNNLFRCQLYTKQLQK